MSKKKKRNNFLVSFLTMALAVVMICSCFVPYFANKTEVLGIAKIGAKMDGFDLVSALFANPDSENYEAKGDSIEQKTFYSIFVGGKSNEDNGGTFTFMYIIALSAIVLGILGALGGLSGVLMPKKKFGMAKKGVFALASVLAIVGIFMASSIATALSTGSFLGTSSTTSVGFGIYMYAIGSVGGLVCSFFGK